MKTILVKYTNYRLPQFQICTKIVDDGNCKKVIKQPANIAAVRHVAAIEYNYHLLKKISKDFDVCPCIKQENEVVFDFAEGEPLEEHMIEAVKKKDTARLYSIVSKVKNGLIGKDSNLIKFYNTPDFESIFGDIGFQLENVIALQIANIDCTPGNILVYKEKYTTIDYEYVTDFPVPLDFIMYRFISMFANNHTSLIDKTITRDEFFKLFGFSVNISILDEMMQRFHNYICKDPKTNKDFFIIKAQYAKQANHYMDLQSQLQQQLNQSEYELEQAQQQITQAQQQTKQLQQQLEQDQQRKQIQGQVEHSKHLEQVEQQTKQAQQLEQAQRQIDWTQKQLEQVKQYVDEIKKSNSWKITAPFRAFSSALKWLLYVVKNTEVLYSRFNKKKMRLAFKYLLTLNFSALFTGINNTLHNDIDDFDQIPANIDIFEWASQNIISEFEPLALIYELVIDIIIPVYNGFEYLEDLLASIKQTSVKYNLLIINDASPDERILPFLQQIKNTSGKVKIVTNEKNLGFVQTVNKGFALARNHVVIVNTDVQLPPKWLERLVAPFVQNNKIASVTPFTNAGTICSFPDFCKDNELFMNLPLAQIDQAFSRIKPTYTHVPTGVGFCMAINRYAIKEIGIFDADTFGKGYGEENDWCQRAIKAGYINVIAENLFVYHKHGGSFPNAEKVRLIEQNLKRLEQKHTNYTADVSRYCQADPHNILRQYISLQLMLSHCDKKPVLIFEHNMGGGASVYRKIYMQNKVEQGYPIMLIRYMDNLQHSYMLDIWIDGQQYVFELFRMEQVYSLLSGGLDRIVINELASYPDIYRTLDFILALKQYAKTELIMLLHDYFAICPSTVLLDTQNVYCEIPPLEYCQSCLPHNKLNQYKNYVDIVNWRNAWQNFLQNCDTIIAFSNSSKNILQKAYPNLNQITVIPHRVDYISKIHTVLKNTLGLVIGIVGAIDERKGILIIEQMLSIIREKDLDIKIVLIGYHNSGIRDDNFTVTGRYDIEHLPELTISHGIDVFLISSICPETFSYTTEEVMKMDMPVACFNLGAPAERVALYSKGLVISKMDAAHALDEIMDFHQRSILKINSND